MNHSHVCYQALSTCLIDDDVCCTQTLVTQLMTERSRVQANRNACNRTKDTNLIWFRRVAPPVCACQPLRPRHGAVLSCPAGRSTLQHTHIDSRMQQALLNTYATPPIRVRYASAATLGDPRKHSRHTAEWKLVGGSVERTMLHQMLGRNHAQRLWNVRCLGA